MSDCGYNCDTNDVKRPTSLNPKEVIDIKGGSNIVVNVEDTAEKKIYTISYQEHLDPQIALNVDVGISKVGVTVSTANFSGSIIKGTQDIATRTMTPDKGLDLTANPFSWQESDIVGSEPGLYPQFSGVPTTVEVEDVLGNVISKQIGVEYRHLFYVGYSSLDTLTEDNIKALVNQDLLKTIKAKYGTYTYNYTVSTAYIYWVFPNDTTPFTSASEGPLPVPLKLDHPDVVVTDEGISKAYRVIRTSTKSKYANATIKLT